MPFISKLLPLMLKASLKLFTSQSEPYLLKKERNSQVIPDFNGGRSPSVTQLMVQCIQLTQFNFSGNLLMQISSYNLPFHREIIKE